MPKMKEIIKNSVLKKILIIIIVVIMSANFIMPTHVYAESIGQKVVSGVFYLIAYVGDVGLSIMQKLMVGTGDLEVAGDYEIKYSPGIIFSNVVPALDINFIGATAADNEDVPLVNEDIDSKKDMLAIAQNLQATDFGDTPLYTIEETTNYNEINDEIAKYGIRCEAHYFGKDSIVKGYDIYFLNNKQYNLTVENYGDWGAMSSVKHLFKNGYSFAGAGRPNSISLYTFKGEDGTRKLYKIERFSNKSDIYECNSSAFANAISAAGRSSTVTLTSTAFALKDNIARWYIALRTFALVGLLSVLVYLGIRMLLGSTSAQQQAKYKSMLKDWVIAVCILFILHYLMAFMLGFVGKINDMFSSNVLVTDSVTNLQTDTIMNKVRTEIGDNFDNASVGLTAGYTLMYLVLVILTGVFTFQYLKRVVYMAFLTMIAPLIALTYPIDKVKDGQAQAFRFWLKEYIVNCLIQPVHLLLYILLISNVMDFAEENVLYAIVAITFLMPAEKIIKQMFGINSQSSYNALGAAAGGAMVMNMLNKAKSLGPKGGSGNKGGSPESSNSGASVRTATRNGMDTPGATTGMPAGAPVSAGASSGGTPSPGGAGTPAGSPTGGGRPGSGGAGSPTGAPAGGGTSGPGSTGTPTGGPAGGTSGSGGTRTRRPTKNRTGTMAGLARVGRRIVGPSPIKSSAKWVAKNSLRAATGLAGATIGLAASIADGDTSDLFHKTVLGASAGTAIGDNAMGLGKEIASGVESLGEEFQRGVMGDEAYENAQADKKFYEGKGYQKILSSSTLSSRYSDSQIKEQTQMFLDNGITDAGEIQQALEAGVNGDEYRTISDLGINDAKKYSKIRGKKGSLKPAEIASRMAIAKNMPTEIAGNKDAFVRYAKRYGIQQTDAEALFGDIDDFI